MKNKVLSIAALLLTGALLFAGCGTSASSSGKTDSSSENTMFSSMETTDLDGNAVDSSIFAQNKITLVNTWNVGCTPCVNEIPELDKINQDFAGKGAAVLGLYCDFGEGISDDELAKVKEILDNADASFTQLRMDGTLATDDTLLNLMTFPTTYVVDSEGTILDTIEGSNDYDGWKSVIESYLSQME